MKSMTEMRTITDNRLKSVVLPLVTASGFIILGILIAVLLGIAWR